MNKKFKKTVSLLLASLFISGVFAPDFAEAKVSKEDKQRAKQYYSQGLNYFGNNDMKNAAKSFLLASETNEENPLYFLLAGDALRYLKQYPASIRNYEKALDTIRKGNKKIRNKIKLKAYLGLASAYSEKNDNAKAISCAEKAVDEFPDDYRGHLALGNIYFKDDARRTDAIKEYEKSLEIKKEQLPAYIKLAILYNKVNDTANVVKTYKQAVDYRPLDERMKLYLAQVLMSWKEGSVTHYAEAIEVLESLKNLNPKNALVHYYLATLYTLEGNFTKSDSELAVLSQLNPNLGHKLDNEIMNYRRRKDVSVVNTNVSFDEATGQTKIVITSDGGSSPSFGNTIDEITLDEEDKESVKFEDTSKDAKDKRDEDKGSNKIDLGKYKIDDKSSSSSKNVKTSDEQQAELDSNRNSLINRQLRDLEKQAKVEDDADKS